MQPATDLADSYVRQFLKTAGAAVRAREGGYEEPLKCYLREAAWVQAQMILGRTHVGYSCSVLFGPRASPDEAFFEKAKEQAARGHIRVQVPAERVRQWKVQAQGQGRQR